MNKGGKGREKIRIKRKKAVKNIFVPRMSSNCHTFL